MKSFWNWYINDIHHSILLCVPEEAESTRTIQRQLFGFVGQGFNIRMVSKGNKAVPRKQTRISLQERQRSADILCKLPLAGTVHVFTSERLNSSFWQVSSKVRQSDPKQHLFHSSQPAKQCYRAWLVLNQRICIYVQSSYSSTYWDTW